MNPEDNRTDGKLEAGSVVAHSRFLRWLDNFWYHNKWVVIIATFFVVMLVVGAVQIFSKESFDITVTYAGPCSMDVAQNQADVVPKRYVEAALESVCPTDFDKNGQVNVQCMTYQVYEEVPNPDEPLAIKFNVEERQNFLTYAGTGKCQVYLLSPYLYSTLRASDRICPVAELYEGEELPSSVMADGYGVALKDTDFYRNNAAAKRLPADTIVCFLKGTVMTGDTELQNAKEMFRALVVTTPAEQQ